MTGFVGSSNLPFAGLAGQGELNVDVLEHDACARLAAWFEARCQDRWCLDIGAGLAAIIDASWAADRLVPPWHAYLRMARHLAQEARAGLAEFRIPKVFGETLFDFQVTAVKIAAHHLHKREDADDWRDLLRLYLVRRTRGFILQHYARRGEHGAWLPLADGRRSYFRTGCRAP